MTEKKEKADQEQREECRCPLCAMARMVDDQKDKHDQFFDHIKKAEVEFLRAIRSLIDDRIDRAEKKPGKKAAKIKVD